MKRRKVCAIVLALAILSGCGATNQSIVVEEQVAVESSEQVNEEPVVEEAPVEDVVIEPAKSYKEKGNTNPIITQTFGADPYAMVYGDTIYFYMTADAFEHEATGEIKENTYSRIKSIHVVSTKDMKNFTDHGLIPVAGRTGIASWANNSWAPAACWKNIDGVDKFFLYFADNGGGIGVLVGDSPVGPFEDPLGKGLITRDVPNCDNVLWLFDPAVLVDDDGTGYLYFGGGVPEGKADAPGTGRVVKLGADMISLDGEPVVLDAPYLFEDSGIHKYNNKYYYSYCTNWNVDTNGKDTYGFENAEIVTMVSDNPMGPFEFKEVVLSNPGKLCGLYGNNHHCIFSFNDQWYITYHSRMLEKKMGVEKGYRSTCIDAFDMGEDGTIGRITQTYTGPEQLMSVNPFEKNQAVCVANMVGTESKATNKDLGYGDMILGKIETGDYVEIDGVDFKADKANSFCITANVPKNKSGKIHVRIDYINSEDVCVIDLEPGDGMQEYSGNISTKLEGEHTLYFLFEGEEYTVESWTVR